MPRVLTLPLLIALAIAATAGCSKNDGLLRTQGRVMKGGQPFIPEEGQFIQVIFVPIMPAGEVPSDHYVAMVDQATGTFVPAGAKRQGMPPGKYRVAVKLKQNKKDLLGGKFDEELSPYVVDVDAATQEIVIDLDNPPTTS